MTEAAGYLPTHKQRIPPVACPPRQQVPAFFDCLAEFSLFLSLLLFSSLATNE